MYLIVHHYPATRDDPVQPVESSREHDAVASVFAGPGEMRARIRDFDWAATPLGPICGWPQSLVTAVGIMLGTRQPAHVSWGPEHIGLYNDAYASLLGSDKHPAILGRSAPEVWREVWAVTGVDHRQVMTGGVATWHENLLVPIERDGVLEDRWWTFSCGPIHHAGAPHGVGGVMTLIVETTRHIAAPREGDVRYLESEARQTFLLALSDRLRSLSDLDAMVLAASEMLARRLRVARAGFAKLDANGETVILQDWTDGTAPSSSGEYTVADWGAEVVTAFRSGDAWLIADVDSDPRPAVRDHAAAYARLGIKATIAVPLRRQGVWVAVFLVYSGAPRAWTDAEVALTREVGERLWDATERTHLVTALRAEEARQAFLLRLSDVLRPLADPVAIQNEACRLLCEQLDVNRVNYADIDGDEFVVRYSYVKGVAPVTGRVRLTRFAHFMLDSYRRDGAILIEDVARDPRFDDEQRARYADAGIAAAASVMLQKEGRWVASFAAHSVSPRRWTADEAELVREVGERLWAAVERAQAEATLRDTQRRLEDALHIARMAYWDWDPASDRVVVSASMGEVFGLHPSMTFDSSPFVFTAVHPDDRDRHEALVRRAAARSEGWHTEFRIVRARDGEVAWLEERATVTRDPVTGEAHTTGLVWDITDRKRAEAAAAHEREDRDRDALRRQLAAAEEAERRRLARELHDQLGQHLTALTLGLAETRRLLDAGQSADVRLAQLEELSGLLTRDARHLALELRPPELDDVGLESALATYVGQWSARYGVEADVAVTDLAASCTMPADLKTTIYRIVQEALTNVAKHAEARQATVLLDRRGGHVGLVVEDDGRGFDPVAMAERIRSERRLGLASMRERATLVGGTLEVESSPGSGTAIYVRLPLETR